MRQRASNEGNHLLTEGDGAIYAEPLSLERLAGWARYPCIGLRLESLDDLQGTLPCDVLGALCVGRTGQRVFISPNGGCLQVPPGILCDRFAALDVAEAKFVAAMASYFGGETREDAPQFLSAECDPLWGVPSSAYLRGVVQESDGREQHCFDWTMLYACQVVLRWMIFKCGG